MKHVARVSAEAGEARLLLRMARVTRTASKAAVLEARCAICWEELHDVLVTACAHSFCRCCIIRALGYKKECPTCRTPIESHRRLLSGDRAAAVLSVAHEKRDAVDVGKRVRRRNKAAPTQRVQSQQTKRKPPARARSARRVCTSLSLMFGPEVVGRRVAVWWSGDAQWFDGVVALHLADAGRHRILYDDGEKKVHDLADEDRHGQLRWLDEARAAADTGPRRAEEDSCGEVQPAAGCSAAIQHTGCGAAIDPSDAQEPSADAERHTDDEADVAFSGAGTSTGHVAGDRWAVDRLLDRRPGSGRTEYLVRWAGWSAAFDSWEDEDDIDDVLIDDFEHGGDGSGSDESDDGSGSDESEYEYEESSGDDDMEEDCEDWKGEEGPSCSSTGGRPASATAPPAVHAEPRRAAKQRGGTCARAADDATVVHAEPRRAAKRSGGKRDRKRDRAVDDDATLGTEVDAGTSSVHGSVVADEAHQPAAPVPLLDSDAKLSALLGHGGRSQRRKMAGGVEPTTSRRRYERVVDAIVAETEAEPWPLVRSIWRSKSGYKNVSHGSHMTSPCPSS